MTINFSTMPTAPVQLDKAHKDLQKASQQFEGYFLHQLLVEMRKTVPEDGLLQDDAHQEETFRDMMDQTLADTMSQRGDFGLGKMLYNQLSQADAAPAPNAKVDTRR